jgi:hypothetical protein
MESSKSTFKQQSHGTIIVNGVTVDPNTFTVETYLALV